MRYPCTISHRPDNTWLVRHEGAELGSVQATGTTREQALEKMRGELRYRLELCPCTGESYQHIEIELAERRLET